MLVDKKHGRIDICIISQLKQKTWQFKKRGVDKKNNSREEKEGERTAEGAAMSGTTLKF